tara:strand:+ start:43 stop:435 length:393 start_codon:yes stop_codon:yes gene_type:complete
MDKIEIYTNKTCPYCKQIKEKLTEENIEFENKITEDFAEEYQKVVNLISIPSIPVIKYKDEYLVAGRDFQNPEHLINVLESIDESSHTYSRRTFERIKTLNFHMANAFARVDQLLKQIETNTKKEEDEAL